MSTSKEIPCADPSHIVIKKTAGWALPKDQFWSVPSVSCVGVDEQRLVDAGIRLPALVDAGLIGEGPERLRHNVLESLYRTDSQKKVFGADSSIELRRERLPWYLPGFLRVTAACVLLVVLTWLATRVLFVWT